LIKIEVFKCFSFRVFENFPIKTVEKREFLVGRSHSLGFNFKLRKQKYDSLVKVIDDYIVKKSDAEIDLFGIFICYFSDFPEDSLKVFSQMRNIVWNLKEIHIFPDNGRAFSLILV
jgi:hypothetical protein